MRRLRATTSVSGYESEIFKYVERLSVYVMSEDTITAVEVQETEYGEELVLQSPYDAKEFIQALPWKELQEEVEEHGSLRAKLASRGVADAAIDAAEDFEFSDDFAAHPSWDPNGLGYEDGAWTIDVDAWEEASEFFEFVGFETEVQGNVNL